MLSPGMVFAKMAAIGQRSLSHYSSFVERARALSPGRLSEVNRWVGMSGWFLPSPVFMFHIVSWAHFNQIASKLVAGSGGWGWNEDETWLQTISSCPKLDLGGSWAVCWALSEPQGEEVLCRFGFFRSVFSPALPNKNNFSNPQGV